MKSFRLALIVTGSALLLAPAGASAATIPVNNTNDEFNTGPQCSLREAVQTANTDAAFGGCAPQGGFTSDPDEIELPSGLYALNQAGAETDVQLVNDFEDLDVLGEVIIKNTGTEPARINGSALSRVFDLQAAGDGTTLSGLTIENAKETFGGAIRNGAKTLIENSTLSNNESTAGQGGAIYTAGTGDLTLENVTISNNKATTFGGGLAVAGIKAALLGVTITGNTADSDGNGGVGDNGGGLSTGVPTTIQGTLIAGNTDASPGAEAPDCFDLSALPLHSLSSLGNNLIGNTTGCNYVAGSGDVTDVDPKLDPLLADNGGNSFTHALQLGSPAVNKGSAQQRPTDQRGELRQDKPDIGAYELHACGGLEATLVGTNAKNTLVGTPGVDAIVALGGNDLIRGLGGGDKVCAGPGRDKAKGGGGKDLLRGEAGKDTLLGQVGRDRLIGGPGADILRGGPGRDVLRGGPGRDKLKQ
jgi:CSLREA domain-containing protein